MTVIYPSADLLTRGDCYMIRAEWTEPTPDFRSVLEGVVAQFGTPPALVAPEPEPKPEPKPLLRQVESMRVRSGYFDEVLDDPDAIIEEAKVALAGVDFDTFVAIGLSGTIITPMLARALDKNYLILRKHDDTSTHSGRRSVGDLGKRWVFCDDFVSSGTTRRRVMEQLREEVENWGDKEVWDANALNPEWRPEGGNPFWMRQFGAYVPAEFTTEYVGTYSYARCGGFEAAEYHADESDLRFSSRR